MAEGGLDIRPPEEGLVEDEDARREREEFYSDKASMSGPASNQGRDQTWPERRQEAITLSMEDLVQARKEYAKKVYWVVVWWLIFLGAVTLANGANEFSRFKLTDGVMIALVTGATVNLLGLFAIVVKYFFSEKTWLP